MNNELYWKVNTLGLLNEIADHAIHKNSGVLKVPLNALRILLGLVAKRAIELNDKELNKLMILLGLYENCNSKEYNEYLKT